MYINWEPDEKEALINEGVFAAEGLRLILDKGDEVANALWAIAEALEEEKGGENNADC